MKFLHRALAILFAFALSFSPAFGVFSASAAVSAWQKGITVVPQTTTDFSSGSFQQSMRNAKATGANYVALIYPIYQSDQYSTDINPGWNTPTDASLASAIDYVHSLGMKVTLKIHIEPYSGAWRAYINPSDRTTWYQKYGDTLVHVAQIGQAHQAEVMVLGTELVSMSASNMNPTNTQNWQAMISRVRAVYTGKLTYSANSTNNNTNAFENEKKFIGFWGSLDYAALSAYYNLNTGANDVNSLMGQWDYWNKNDIQAFAASVGKPVLLGEIGYRSVTGAHQQPWNWQMGGGVDQTEQANDYQALFQYWNDYGYVAGVYLWDWSTNPNAGGNDTSYTPQNKQAQQIMTNWFTNPPAPGGGTGGGTPQPPPSSGAFSSTVVSSNSNPPAGQSVSLTANVKANSGSLNDGVIDIEIFNSGGSRVLQQFYEHQNIATGGTNTHQFNFTPPNAGNYRIAMGVFSSGWASNLNWNENALTLTVGGASAPPPPPPPPPPTSTTTPPTGTTTPPTNNPPPTGSYTTNIWWPTDGAKVTGTQPFKAQLSGLDISQYQMYWQVDGDRLNIMSDSQTDYPHKEVLVDVSGWSWKGAGPYTLNFVSKNSSGTVISQKSVNILTQ